MKKFIIGTIVTVLILVITISVQQGLLFAKPLPYDDEQKGLDTQITIHLSHVVAENTPKGQAANKFAELVEEKTKGKVKVHVYSNSSLFNDENEFQALQKGEVEMIIPTFSKMTTYVPNWQVLDLPYLFNTNEEVQEVLTGMIGDQLLNELEAIHIKGLGFWYNGFKHLTSVDHPIHTFEDLQGLRIRTMPSKTLEKQFEVLKATPIPISFSEVYTDLEKHAIDAQENTASNIYSKGFYKVQKHMTITQHGILGYAVLMNENFWDSLPVKIQHQLVEAMKETTDWQFEQAARMNEQDMLKLKQQDDFDVSTMSLKERQRFKEQLAPVYDFYRAQLQNDSILTEIEKIVAP
ncbi:MULTISPECIES: TRAP transporter substrate-binding protein [Lysinibacillus]|uniref:TRAP transporter substrate-binding protein n=1 Tax=Lysinibacillus TaxID=400634 RepID=UPI0004DF52F2|nr:MULTISPECIES: TRAP transporter substrate-binding protein [Lysinibacillus]MBG9693868.1 C4-dicarboxylate ABC transporter [Lysinibacillus sphaericus]MBG9756651.1 C4-dicarboxylate ABC transporter [Lysinibacillus sphaericus]MBI6863421.1 TRAP transporter substrate-binding protein [Lysinibacillus fusiformis]MDM5351760.1 TRAP transporter substrate-binding protein [Lysinibacillus sphaericus]QPA57549.1 TRAP transporter substrate-binding protein [Lysinibacillus sphaericus]